MRSRWCKVAERLPGVKPKGFLCLTSLNLNSHPEMLRGYILDLSPRGNTTKRRRFLYLTDGEWDTEEERVINHNNLINVQLTVSDGDFLTEGTYEVIGNIGDNQEFYWLNWHVNLDDGEIGSIMDDGTLDIRLQNDLLFVDFTAKEFRGADDFVVTGTYEGIVEVYLSS